MSQELRAYPSYASSENVHGRVVDKHTITVVADNDNLVLDVAGDVSHRVPNRGNLLIDYRRSGRSSRGEIVVYHD